MKITLAAPRPTRKILNNDYLAFFRWCFLFDAGYDLKCNCSLRLSLISEERKSYKKTSRAKKKEEKIGRKLNASENLQTWGFYLR